MLDISGRNEFPLQVNRVHCKLGGVQCRDAASPHLKKPAEVARTSVLDASWTPPSGDVASMSHQEETQVKNRDTLSLSIVSNDGN